MKCDLVLAGCGVLGAAYAGVLEKLDEMTGGLDIQRIAGTSAGSIAAVLIASGHSPKSLTEIMLEADFRKFKDARLFRRAWDFNVHGGLYQGLALEKWLRELTKGIRLGDTDIPVSVIAFDIRNYRSIVFSSETHPEMPVALAARMSAAIPLFFRSVPYVDGDIQREMIDGGVLQNFPVEIFDTHCSPRWPTIGCLIDDSLEAPSNIKWLPKGPETALKLFSAIRHAYNRQLSEHNAYRSVLVPSVGISSVDFDLSMEVKRALHRLGSVAAGDFLGRWHVGGGFEGYKQAYRA